MNLVQVINIFITGIYILILPGLLWSYIFFKKEAKWVERIAISFALSISIIPLLTFYSNVLGIPTTRQSVIMQVFVLILLAIAVLHIKYFASLLKKDIEPYAYKKSKVPIIVAPEEKKRKPIFKKLHIISVEAFQVFLVTYLCLLLVEIVKPGFVSYFFNLNILLVVVFVSGVVMVLTHSERRKNIIPSLSWNNIMRIIEQGRDRNEAKRSLEKWDSYYIWGMSLGGAVLVYYKTEELGALSFVMTAITFAIIYLLCHLVFSEVD